MSPSPQEEEWPGAGALLQSGPERRPGHYTGTHPLRTTPEGSPPGRNPVPSLNPETRLSGSVEAATRPSLHVSDWRRLREGTERTSEVVPVTKVYLLGLSCPGAKKAEEDLSAGKITSHRQPKESILPRSFCKGGSAVLC